MVHLLFPVPALKTITLYILLLAFTGASAQADICLSTASYSPLNKTGSTASVAFADFNHDGYIDFVVAGINTGDLNYWNGNVAGSFSQAAYVSVPNNSAARFVIEMDFNNDGWQDIAATVQSIPTASVIIYLNNNGVFSQSMGFSVNPYPGVMAASDLNNDNLQDLVIASSSTANTISVFKNNGNLQFTHIGTYTTCSSQTALICRDFDQDGKTDLFSGAGGCSRFFENTGNAVFIPQPFGNLSCYGYYSLCTATSLMADNDALPDVACSSGSMIAVYRNLGNFIFLATQTLSTEHMAQAISACDMNSDGKPDICAASYGRTLHVYENNGQGIFTPKWRDSLSFNGTPTYVKGIDLNNDSKDDLFVGHDNSSLQHVYINCNSKDVGLKSQNRKSISVFPVPASNFIYIENEGEGEFNVSILDNSGEIIKDFVQKVNPIDVSQLAPGFYHLKFSVSGQEERHAMFVKIQE